MGTERRGLASMDPARRREIASMGGKAVHRLGLAHTFKPGEEARIAGRKGGLAPRRKRAETATAVEEAV